VNQLNLSLSKANLSYDLSLSSWSQLKFEFRLAKIVDALCAAYEEKDGLLLDAITDFLKELLQDQTSAISLETSKLLPLVQQILYSSDFADDSNHFINESTFRFLRTLLELSPGNIRIRNF
jgi:hypothetical protein